MSFLKNIFEDSKEYTSEWLKLIDKNTRMGGKGYKIESKEITWQILWNQFKSVLSNSNKTES